MPYYVHCAMYFEECFLIFYIAAKMAAPTPSKAIMANEAPFVVAPECLPEVVESMPLEDDEPKDVALGALVTRTALGTADVPVVISSMLVVVALKFVWAIDISLLARS